jgi:hypothetical protein
LETVKGNGMKTNKIVRFLLIGLFVLSVTTNAILLWALIKKHAELQSFGDAHRIVAREVFFDALKKDQIDIFALPPATDGVVPCCGYSVRIRQLSADPVHLGKGAQHFIQLYHSLALDFACSKWEEDKALSLGLISIMGRVYQPAFVLAQMISEQGVRDSSVTNLVHSYSRRFEWSMDKVNAPLSE